MRALGGTVRCVPCVAMSLGCPELAVRGALVTMKSQVTDDVGICTTCGARRLVYRLGAPSVNPFNKGARPR